MTREMEIEVSKIVRNLKTASFDYVYATKKTANQLLEKQLMPCVVNMQVISGEVKFSTGVIKDEATCIFAFIDKPMISESRSQDTQPILDAMLRATKEFVARINTTPYFVQVVDYKWDEVEAFDIGVVGIVFEITLKQRAGIQACELL